MDMSIYPRKSLMTRKKLYVHAGIDKTGSTAIQRFCKQNQVALHQRGVTYMRHGRAKAVAHNHNELKRQAAVGDYSGWQAVAEELRADSNSTGLVSFEGFYRFNRETWRNISETLGNIDVIMILYIRRQSDKLRSGVVQQIKQSNARQPSWELTDEQLCRRAPNYKNILGRFSDVFGESNIVVRRYEKSKFFGGAQVADFLNAIGLSFDGEPNKSEFVVPAKRANPTLDSDESRFLETLNQLDIGRPARSIVRDHLAQTHGANKTSFISDASARRIDEYHADNNAEVAKKWFSDEVLFSEEPAFVYQEPRPGVINRLVNDMMHWHPHITKLSVWNKKSFLDAIAENSIALVRGFYPIERWGVWMYRKAAGELWFRIPINTYGDLEVSIKGRYARNVLTVSQVRVYGGDWVTMSGGQAKLNVPWRHYAERYGHVVLEFDMVRSIAPYH